MSSNGPPCSSMAIFQGDYWWDVENSLFPSNPIKYNHHNNNNNNNGDSNGLHHSNSSSTIDSTLNSTTTTTTTTTTKSSNSSSNSNSSNTSTTSDLIHLDSVFADEIEGICVLHFSSHPRNISRYPIKINSTTIQDIVMILGPPSERFFKEDSRLSIFNPEGSDEKEQATLFFNYFFLGIDICFDTSLRNATVKKIILHGNVAGGISFQKYERCRWKLHSRGQTKHLNDEGGGSNNGTSVTTISPTSEMKFKQFSHLYPFKETPMLLNRSLEGGASSLNDDGMEIIGESEDHHFDSEKLEDWGLTDLYGAPGLVIEVLKNGDIASLTIY